ncbi:chloride channel protein CLC-f isoform X2 [Carya illinoinensis]|uniref:chloride channel protein CLC-f isoform X2 n=1 Tax=Carya illinoinensis TaxID=32201 RepID=UPI001C724E89|nr:chloride channel protein CLC-f isoform X2 [Carya illinoinensis]
MSGGGEYSDENHLPNPTNSNNIDEDELEAQERRSANINDRGGGGAFQDLLKHLDRGFSGRRHSFKRVDIRDHINHHQHHALLDNHNHLNNLNASDANDVLGDSAPPEWALLLIGCLLGLATGLFVAAFNKGVHVIHEWAWAGTPNEGAAWLRLQRLADTWHRILLIPVTGGVTVGMMHGLLEILHQIRQSSSSQRRGFDLVAGVFPTIKAIQAAVTLGTGCSLGPEGPSVDIGKSCAYGFSLMMENNRERKIALVAAGAAAGIASELPLYLILGMLCGVVSVAFTRLVAWFTKSFDFIKEKFDLPAVVCPALGGLGAGIIALKYPGILYWGFTNVEEILHTGKTASAPGIWLLTQLSAAKVVATALCKGSGLVGGLYAPSLMIGAAVGAVFGGLAAELINSAIPGNAAVAQPQAYALVGMAATLASVCSVPLTSVLLLFELTRDYRILLPLMGAVGLAIWVPSVTNQTKESEASDTRGSVRGYTSISPAADEVIWRGTDGRDDLELSVMGNVAEEINDDMLLEELKVYQAMSKNCVKILLAITLKEAIDCMHGKQQKCAAVVDEEDFLEGILTYGDIRRSLSMKPSDTTKSDSRHPDVNTMLVSAVCTRGISYRGQERGILTCYPDTNLAIAKELMEAKGIKQLPVVKRGEESKKGRKRRIVALLHYDSIWNCLREEINRRKTIYQHRKENNLEEIVTNGH